MSQRSLYAAALAVAVAALTATPAMAAVPAPPPVSSGGHTGLDDPAAMDRPALDPEVAEAAGQAQAEEAQAADETASAHRTYKGRVTARTGLLLRDKPTRSSRVVGSAAYGSIVHIFCKTPGDSVNGNNRWYLLADGTWAWASAAYIDNIGKAPRWC